MRLPTAIVSTCAMSPTISKCIRLHYRSTSRTTEVASRSRFSGKGRFNDDACVDAHALLAPFGGWMPKLDAHMVRSGDIGNTLVQGHRCHNNVGHRRS